MSFDPSTWRDALGVSGGWLLSVLLGLSYLISSARGWLVSSKTLETILRVKEEALQSELEARQLWQKAAMDQLDINDLERETSRRISAAVEATLKVVTDLQAANDLHRKQLGGRPDVV